MERPRITIFTIHITNKKYFCSRDDALFPSERIATYIGEFINHCWRGGIWSDKDLKHFEFSKRCSMQGIYHFLVDGKLSFIRTGVFLSGRGVNPTSRVVAVRF